MVTTYTHTIGALGDYTTIALWLTATGSKNLVSLDERYIGELIDDSIEVDSGVIVVSGCTTDATRYRHLKASEAGGRYNPASNVGPKVYGSWLTGTAAETMIDIQEDHFRMTGFGLICEDPLRTTGTGGNVKAGIKIDADGVRLFSVLVSIAEGGTYESGLGADPYFTCFWIGSSGADDAQFWDCIALGSPFNRGATTGWHFDSFATGGGVYCCAAHSMTRGNGRGFLALSSGDQPEIVNCIATDCTSACIAGLWSYWTRLVTSDEHATSAFGAGVNGDGLPYADPYSFAYQTGRALWFAPNARDLRLIQSSVARGAGLAISVEMMAAGAESIEDWTGPSSTRAAGSWSIGPIEDYASPHTSPASIIEYDIGSGLDFDTIALWLADMEGQSCVFRNEIHVGIVHDEGEIDLGTDTLDAHRCLADATHYRELRAAPGSSRYDPVYDTGVRLTGSLGATSLGLFDICEDYFRLNGIRFESTYASSSSRSVVRVTGHRSLVDAVAVIQESGTGSSTIGIDVDASFCLLSNSIAIGAGNGTSGLTRGILVHDGERSRALQCVADLIDGVGGAGYGIREGSNVSRVEFVNCIATGSGSGDFNHPSGFAHVTQANCLSSDATAEGPGAQPSVSRATIWNAPDTGDFGDYRLVSGSPALDSGRNLSFWLSADWDGERRFAPFDLGIYEGLIAAPLVGKPVWRNDLARIATLWSIFRTDGTTLRFTDANEPLDFGGATYDPTSGMMSGSTRAQSGLKENSLSAYGAISSDRITAEDLSAGRYRDARVEVVLIDWRYPFAAPLHRETFWIADVECDDAKWKADPVGIAQRLEESVGNLSTADCPYRLGDDDCKKDISADMIDDVEVVGVSSEYREFDAASTDISASYVDDYFRWGTIEWLTGSNVGLESEVKKYTSGSRRFVLTQETAFPIEGGDTFYLRPGCGGRYLTDCVGLWGNGRNFGGDPFMPGAKAQFQTPQQ